MKREEFLAKVGVQILNLRKARGLSQAELAKMIGTQDTAIRRFEQGSNLTIGTLFELAKALNVNVSDIITTE